MPIREWLAGEGSDHSEERGYRGWARHVYTQVRSMRKTVCVPPHSENDWCVPRTSIEPELPVRRYWNFPF